MDIVVYRRDFENVTIRKVMDAFCKGLQTLNIPFEQRQEKDYRESDIAVVFSQYKKKLHESAKHRLNIYEKHDPQKLIVLERGFINRQHYHSIGIGGVNGAATFPAPFVCSRDRFDDLGVELKEWHSGDFILLTGQVPWDATVQHVDYKQWIIDTIIEIRKYTDKPIKFRPHPVQPKAVELSTEFCRQFNVYWDTGDKLEDSLEEAHACVTLCSNSSIDALLHGVPTFTLDDNAVAKIITNSNIKNIETPHTTLRDLFFYSLAYCQWNLEEMETGKFWPQFEEYFKKL